VADLVGEAPVAVEGDEVWLADEFQAADVGEVWMVYDGVQEEGAEAGAAVVFGDCRAMGQDCDDVRFPQHASHVVRRSVRCPSCRVEQFHKLR